MSAKKTAMLDFSLTIECDCGEDFNVFEQDYDDILAKAVITDTLEDCEGAKVECPKCKSEIIIGKVEY